MFDKIKHYIEIRKLKREMNAGSLAGAYTVLFEQYIHNFFLRYGQIDSILLGKFYDGELDIGNSSSKNDCKASENQSLNIKQGNEEIYSNVEQLIRHYVIEPAYSCKRNEYKISENPLWELMKEVEAQEAAAVHNIPRRLVDSLRNANSVDELNALFPTQYFRYIRQWYKQHNTWNETEPTETVNLSFMDSVIGDNNNVHFKSIFSSKCDLTVTREIVSPFTWRIDFSGQWPDLF